MNTGNPFGSQQSGQNNPFGGQQSGLGNPFGGQQSGMSTAFGGQPFGTSSIFGSQQSGAASTFGGQTSGSSNLFGPRQPVASSIFGQQSGASNTFGALQPGASSTFGGLQTTASSIFGASKPGTSSTFGLQTTASSTFGVLQTTANSIFGGPQTTANSSFGGPQQTASNTFGGPQSGASSAFCAQQLGVSSKFGGQQLGEFPASSSSSTGAFQTKPAFQFGQPSTFGQGSGVSGQPAFGQNIGESGKNLSFGQVTSAEGQTSLFGHSTGLTGQTLGFGKGDGASGRTSLFGQSSDSSGQTSVFGQSSITSGQTSVFGQSSGIPGQGSNFGLSSGVARQSEEAGGQASAFGQGSGFPTKAVSFGQSFSSTGQSTSFGSGSVNSGQATSFGKAVGALGQPSAFIPASSPAVQTTLGFGQGTVGSGQQSAFSQSSGVSKPSSSFGQPSVFGQHPAVEQQSGTLLATSLGTTTTALSTSSAASNTGFNFKPIAAVSTFSVPSTLGKSAGVPDFTFKPPENATFKPILGVTSEPDKSQAQMTQETFTFSQPVSSTSSVMTPDSFSSQPSSLSTANTLSLSKPAPTGVLAPTFAFPLPNKNVEQEMQATKAPFGSAISSFTSFSSSSAGLPSVGQAFQTIKSDNPVGADTPKPPGGAAKALKRKEEQERSLSRQEYATSEVQPPAIKNDHPPEKRSLVLNRPSSKLFGRVLKDVLKSNEKTARLRDVKHEELLPDVRELEQPEASRITHGSLRTQEAGHGALQSRTKKGKRRSSDGKTPQRQLRRRSSSADSIGDPSISELTGIQIKNLPEHLNNDGVIRKRFQRYGRVVRVICRREKKVATIHFASHSAAGKARRQEQGWHPGIDIFFLKKKTGPGNKSTTPGGKTEKMLQDSSGRPSAEEQSYPHSPARKKLVRSSVTSSSLLTKGSPVKKYGSAVSLGFEADLFDSGSDGQSADSLVTALASLSHLSGTLGENTDERYRVLDQRDKILRQARVKRTELESAQVFVGTCPDMCPEKERYMREIRNQLSLYEVIPGTDKVDHSLAVKEYSRSSADQEEPLPHELRPTPVLCMTMDYLISRIMDQGEGNYRDWYDFVWNRTRAIRKDITQQHLCNPDTVSLIEKCMRFHIYCSHHLCEEPRSSFEAKINLENTTKCLQSLKEMYQDLANKGIRCSNEAEFRGYSVLLNLNQGDILREVQQFHSDIRNSSEVRFAVQAFAAFNSTNFVRFFRLVKSATYLNSCILHSYFSQIRRDALRSLNVAYTSNQRSTVFPLEMVVRMLLFKDGSEATEFLTTYGLNVSDGFVELSRVSFAEPEGSLKPKKSVFIEQKRCVSVGEVVNGGPLPQLSIHVPVCSFNSQNKFIGDISSTEQSGDSPKVTSDVLGQKETRIPATDMPLVKVQHQDVPAAPPVPQPLAFIPRQVLNRSSLEPDLQSAFTTQPTVQSQPSISSAFTFQQPLVRPAEPQKVSDFTFQQPLVRPPVQTDQSFTPLVQPAATLEGAKASEFTFQQPLVRPTVQPKPLKASEFTFQAPLVRPELSMAFPVQPMVQPDLPAASAFTAPQSLVRPTVHSLQPSAAAPTGSFAMSQPTVESQPLPPPQPEFTEQHVTGVVEELVEESLKEQCTLVGETGAAYAKTALSVSNTEVKELLNSVIAELLGGLALEEMKAEKIRVKEEKRRAEQEKRRAEEIKRKAEEEKRKAEEARLKEERRCLIEQMSQKLCSELAEEVLNEITQQTSASELKCAMEEDRRQCIARCSQQVSHHWTQVFLEEEIFETAKEALQELQCYCKYLRRWREVVVARKKLKHQMRAFPAAPCYVDPKDKLKALLPSAVSPPDKSLFAKGILQLGHAGNVGVSYTRLQWLKEQSMHQMKVQYFHQQLLCEAAWIPLDLPSLIAENLPSYREHVFWKVVLVLPDGEDYQEDYCSKLLSEWLKAKFMRVEELPTPASHDHRIQTLTAYQSLGLHLEKQVRVNVSVKLALGTLTNKDLEQVETQKDLLGTSGLVLMLPPASICSEDLAEEDVYWLSALLQLKQLLQAKPFQPIVPLVIFVPGPEEPTAEREDEVEQGLMLQDLISANLISEYIIVQIPEFIDDLQGSIRVSQAVKWLVSHTPSAPELCCQTLLQFVEDGVCREFSIPFHNDRVERRRASLPSQEPSAIMELYNSVLFFLAEVVSSDKLSELSWPVTEFAEPGGNAALPHLQWNTQKHLNWLKKVVLSFQIPHMDLPPLAAPWRPVCRMIFQYVSQVASSMLTLPILESQVENLLSKTYNRWKRHEEAADPKEDGPLVQDIPWDDLAILCIDHKLRDWNPPKSPIVSEALTDDGQVEVYFFKEDLKKFAPPESWEQARLNTLREIETQEMASASVNRSQVSSFRRMSTYQPQTQDISMDTTSKVPLEVDITYVPSREELLPERLSLSLRAEREESKRFEDQLHRWLTEDSLGNAEDFSLPLYIPQTLVAIPESIKALGRPQSVAEAFSPIERTGTQVAPMTSLSERLEHLRSLIWSSKEQDVACELHLSTLLDVLDN